MRQTLRTHSLPLQIEGLDYLSSSLYCHKPFRMTTGVVGQLQGHCKAVTLSSDWSPLTRGGWLSALPLYWWRQSHFLGLLTQKFHQSPLGGGLAPLRVQRLWKNQPGPGSCLGPGQRDFCFQPQSLKPWAWLRLVTSSFLWLGQVAYPDCALVLFQRDLIRELPNVACF